MKARSFKSLRKGILFFPATLVLSASSVRVYQYGKELKIANQGGPKWQQPGKYPKPFSQNEFYLGTCWKIYSLVYTLIRSAL